jgi:hypothetical protein
MMDPTKSADEKNAYTAPELRVYGSIESMTKTGLTGGTEGTSSSGQKKRNSLG